MSATSARHGEERRRILAMGGGGFTMPERSPALDWLVLGLTGKPLPRICFLPTASGDQREQIRRFYERFCAWPCEPSTLSLFHLARERIDPARHLLSQDAIYVGGGSMRNMLAIWREHGLDEVMRAAWNAGVVLAGLSAGAMCWFEGGISMSGGAPEPVHGLGLLPGSLSVHRDSGPERLPAYLDSVSDGRLGNGYAADDCAALVFFGQTLIECVTSRPGAGACRVSATAGRPDQTPLPTRVLPGARSADPDLDRWTSEEERLAVAEFRLLRTAHRRWP